MTAKRSDAVTAQLKQEILNWELPPGTPLSESELAERLGASRTPIRESLQQLAQEDLVRIVPRKGAFVSEILIADIIELFQMRQAMESCAAGLAARSEQRSILVPFIDEFDAAKDLIANEAWDEFFALVNKFDECLLSLANNRRLAVIVHQVWDQLFRARRLARMKPARLLEGLDERILVIQAIANGDEVGARAASWAHIEASLDAVLQAFIRHRSEPLVAEAHAAV